MVKKHYVEGYEEFSTFIKQFKSSDKVFVYFGGSKLPSGESWCDDCVRAAPVIEKALEKVPLPPGVHFVYVSVGDRPTWKDMNCAFRKDAKTRLMVLPTVMQWNTPKKLVGDQCESFDLLEMLFSDEDD